MNRLSVFALVLVAAFAPAASLAQSAAPAPAATPTAVQSLTYSDPAMSFTAPDGFKRLPIPPHDPAKFGDPAVMAAFVKDGGTTHAISIVLRMEGYDGSPDGWATTADNNLRTNTDSAFIKRTPVTLANGMPVYWEEVTIGSGFNQIKTYQYIWADGVRGVTLALVCRDGLISSEQAKQMLSNINATAYPKYRY